MIFMHIKQLMQYHKYLTAQEILLINKLKGTNIYGEY